MIACLTLRQIPDKTSRRDVYAKKVGHGEELTRGAANVF